MLKAAGCALVLGAWLASACGGRSASDGNGSSGAAGSAGSSAVAGADSGTSGAGAAGAPDTCGTVNCPNIVCPVNTAPVALPGECCETCQSTCTEPCQACGPGSHAVMHSNVCCPSCEPDMPPTPSCESGQMAYATARAAMLEKYSSGCSVDQDCVALGPSNRCEGGCDFGAILASNVNNWTSNLDSAAKTQCVNCPEPQTAKCAAPLPPVCLNRVCQLPVK